MLVSTKEILSQAEAGEFAVGAFNVYNLEGVRAVVEAAEEECLPVIIQIHPESVTRGGKPLVALCLAAAKESSVEMSVHLDHSESEGEIKSGLSAGIRSVMVDGSSLEYEENVIFTRKWAMKIHSMDGFLEAELGRLSGTEDGLTVPDYEAKLTDPELAAEFCALTSVDALAVCIGNVHGKYFAEPNLDFERLSAVRDSVQVPLVLHGASGLPQMMVSQAIKLGVRKLNVNTEIRNAYLNSLRESLMSGGLDITEVMDAAVSSMSKIVVDRIRQFSGRI